MHLPSGFKVWQAIFFTALFATAFMYTIQNYYQKYISEITTSIIFSFEPLFAAITAYFYLNEAITERTVIGGLMIFAGILFAEIKMENKLQNLKRRFSFFKR